MMKLQLTVLFLLVSICFLSSCKKDDTNTGTTTSTTGTTATATTASTSTTATATTASTSTTATTASTSTTATTASTSTTSTTSTTASTSTTSTTSTTSSTSTTGSGSSFIFDGITYAALDGNCGFSSELNELTIYGAVTSGNVSYSIAVEFPDTNPTVGNHTAQYNSGTLSVGKCRAILDVINVSTGDITATYKASTGGTIVLTSSGAKKYKISFNNIDFGNITGGGTAKKKVSATSFGCE